MIFADGAPAAVIERGRAISQVIVYEPDLWIVGERTIDPTDGPRYFVRVSVPGGHLNDGMRAELVRRVTQAVAEVDEDPERLYEEPCAWVHIVEISDGNLGAFGQVVRTADIIKWTVTGERLAADDAPVDVPVPKSAIDPICGMTVELTDGAITLEHEGMTHAFCSTGCRDLFAAQRLDAGVAKAHRGETQ